MRTALAVMAAFLLCVRCQPPPGRARDARGRRQGAGRRHPPPHRRQRPCRRAAGPLVQGKAPERCSTSCRSPTCTPRWAMATDPVYEVYALKHGERDTTKVPVLLPGGVPRQADPALLRLADPGGPASGAGGHRVPRGRRAGARDPQNYITPAAAVERAGIKPADIPISLSATCTTTTGPDIACSPGPSSGSRRKRSPSGRARSEARRPSAGPPTSTRWPGSSRSTTPTGSA